VSDDPVQPLRDCVAALAAEHPAAEVAASRLAKAVEQVRRLVDPAIPSSWLNPRLELLEDVCHSWRAEAAGMPISDADLTTVKRVMKELQPASAGQIVWDPSRMEPPGVFLHAQSVREALRPSLTPKTKKQQNFNALIHLKLLERQLNPDGLPRSEQGGFFRAGGGPPGVDGPARRLLRTGGALGLQEALGRQGHGSSPAAGVVGRAGRPGQATRQAGQTVGGGTPAKGRAAHGPNVRRGSEAGCGAAGRFPDLSV